MRKVDVVVAYYRQHQRWNQFLQGVRANERYINRVIVVNDEPWDKDNKAEFDAFYAVENPPQIPFVFLSHAHDGFGVCKSYNQGMAAAETEYVYVTAADVLMPARHIARLLMLAQPRCIVAGPVNHVTEDATLPLNPEKILRTDRFMSLVDDPDSRPWQYVRGANRLFHRASFLQFDERFNEFNYEDYDHTARWVTNYGFDSVRYDKDAPVFHLGDPYHEPRRCDKSYELLLHSLRYAERMRLNSFDSWVVDFDDLCDATVGTLDTLDEMKARVPGLKVTLFAIPKRTSEATVAAVRALNAKYDAPWLQLAPHGWRHTRGECLSWTSEEAVDKITRAQKQFGDLCAPLFKAPAWLLDGETYEACDKMGVTVYNPGHLGIKNYVHGHLSNTAGNYILDMASDGRLEFINDNPFYFPQEVL